MKPNRGNPSSLPAPLTDPQLDGAFSAANDGILPSSGFTDSVMSAIRQESAAPAPIAFPWRRAIPGIAAALTALVLLALVLLSLVRHAPSAPASPAASVAAQAQLISLLHQTAGQATGGDTLGITLAFVATAAALILCRRLLAAR